MRTHSGLFSHCRRKASAAVPNRICCRPDAVRFLFLSRLPQRLHEFINKPRRLRSRLLFRGQAFQPLFSHSAGYPPPPFTRRG